MKKLFYIFGLSVLITACSHQEENNQDTTTKDTLTIEEEVNIEMFGEPITEEGALTGEEFLAAFEGKDSLETKIKGVIKEVCSKKGCWMKMDLTTDKEMMIRFKDYGFFVPKDAAGRLTIIEGIAKIDTISVEEQKHYLEDAEASQEEIDAITEPEIAYSFEAKGVIIKDEEK